MPYGKLVLAALVVALVAAFYAVGLHDVISLQDIKTQQTAWQSQIEAHPLISALVFAAVYIVLTALPLPSAIVMTLLGGALFGVVWGTVIVSFASTIGATLAMLSARYVLRDVIQTRYGNMLRKLNHGFEKEGAFYLFALRLVPVAPFVFINMAMGLLPIRTPTYYWVSQLGMLPGTLVYVYAGTALAQVESVKDIASPQLLLAFALLGVTPLVTKKALNLLRKERAV